jgi:hypothetical protein
MFQKNHLERDSQTFEEEKNRTKIEILERLHTFVWTHWVRYMSPQFLYFFQSFL